MIPQFRGWLAERTEGLVLGWLCGGDNKGGSVCKLNIHIHMLKYNFVIGRNFGCQDTKASDLLLKPL